MRIALIGLGAIGQELLGCLSRSGENLVIVGALVAHPAKHVNTPCPIFGELEPLLAARPELVVECARQAALHAYGTRVLAAGIDLLVASVGALADERLLDACTQAAVQGRSRMLLPAGALVGIDALAAARQVGLERVVYTRRAPPATWIRSGALSEEEAARHAAAFEIYAGNAREAALKYPKNANVAATIALAGLGFERTEVVLIADPAATGNTHAIRAQGGFGELHSEIRARTISAATTSSKIVAGSLARAVLARSARIAV